ncbi:MAG TPA: GNAT family N-acetyltransferase [Hyphomicrobium sp.]|nr:GNAT family N-acetyltransferase [Hyphomicrobium sp.]
MRLSASADSLLDMLEIRALSVDEMSNARYVVASSFARGASEHYSQPQIDAFVAFVRSPQYTDLLVGNRAYGAFIDGEMVGVAAWSIAEMKSPTARLLAVFVLPLFGGNGIGTRLVEYLEEEARATGYRAQETSALLGARGFFEHLGYHETGAASWSLPSGHTIPVAMMRKMGERRADVMH